MKTISLNSFEKKSFGILASALVLLFLGNGLLSAKPFDGKEPSLKAVVFQTSKTEMTFKAIAQNISGEKLHLFIRRSDGQVIYEETYKQKSTYNRNFKLSDLEDGSYTFEVTNGKDSYKQTFEIKTKVDRSLKVK